MLGHEACMQGSDAHLPFLRFALKAVHVWQNWLDEKWQQCLPEA